MPPSKRPTPLLLAVALALGALGVSLLIKALFFPSEPQRLDSGAPGAIEKQVRSPAPAPPSRVQH
jgi:hypothetical protein